jgi:hypothetical protein
MRLFVILPLVLLLVIVIAYAWQAFPIIAGWRRRQQRPGCFQRCGYTNGAVTYQTTLINKTIFVKRWSFFGG